MLKTLSIVTYSENVFIFFCMENTNLNITTVQKSKDERPRQLKDVHHTCYLSSYLTKEAINF